MKLKLPLAAAFVAALSLSACGGSSSDSSSSTSSTTVASPAALTYIDNVVGIAPQAQAGHNVTVTYTAYLYSTTATNNEGTEVDAGTISFTLGTGQEVKGFDEGVQNMYLGGTRTILVPASLAYGSSGSGAVPANSGMVFVVQLISVNT